MINTMITMITVMITMITAFITMMISYSDYHEDYHDNYHEDYYDNHNDYCDDYHEALTLNLTHQFHLWKQCFPCLWIFSIGKGYYLSIDDFSGRYGIYYRPSKGFWDQFDFFFHQKKDDYVSKWKLVDCYTDS